MPSLSCPTLRTTLDLLALKRESLKLAVTEATATGNFTASRLLQTEIKTTLSHLNETLKPAILAEAEKIFQKNFLGQEAYVTTFGFKIETKDLPPIPFSKQELEAAKKKGYQLHLSWDTFPDGTPITGKTMTEQLKGKTSDGGKILYGDWSKEAFFTAEQPQRGWRLSATKAEQTKQNFLEQTDQLAASLAQDHRKHPRRSTERALAEYQKKKPAIERLWQDYSKNWPEIAATLATLEITRLTRESFPELLERLLLTERMIKKKLLSDLYTWTRSRHSDGHLVNVGIFDRGGADVSGRGPGRTIGRLGVCPSRSV